MVSPISFFRLFVKYFPITVFLPILRQLQKYLALYPCRQVISLCLVSLKGFLREVSGTFSLQQILHFPFFIPMKKSLPFHYSQDFFIFQDFFCWASGRDSCWIDVHYGTSEEDHASLCRYIILLNLQNLHKKHFYF